jgi:hypothetical protein
LGGSVAEAEAARTMAARMAGNFMAGGGTPGEGGRIIAKRSLPTGSCNAP